MDLVDQSKNSAYEKKCWMYAFHAFAAMADRNKKVHTSETGWRAVALQMEEISKQTVANALYLDEKMYLTRDEFTLIYREVALPKPDLGMTEDIWELVDVANTGRISADDILAARENL